MWPVYVATCLWIYQDKFLLFLVSHYLNSFPNGGLAGFCVAKSLFSEKWPLKLILSQSVMSSSEPLIADPKAGRIMLKVNFV